MTPNTAQSERWNGAGGQHWVDHHDAYDRQEQPFGDALLAGAALSADDAVLDVGCGAGTMTLAAATAGRHALGVDLSAPLIALARQRAAGRDDVAFRVADAQVASWPEPVDVVLSRFGVMFFDDPPGAFAHLRAALSPTGGRLAVVCWQGLDRNDWMRVPGEALASVVPLGDLAEPGQPGPFALGDPDRVRSILADAGWTDVTLDAVTTPLRVGGGGTLDEVVEFVRGTSLGRSALTGAPPDVARRAVDAMRDALAPFDEPGGPALPAAAWLVRAAGRPG